jgi:hypothetical protein
MSSHLVRAIIGVGVLGVTIAVAPATGTSANKAAEACARGMHQVTVGGQPGFRFCGPASAVVHMGSRTLRFSNGLCRVAAGAFTVNIGTLVPGLRTGKPPSFGITTHTAKPGKQLNAAVGFAYGGRGYAVADQVVTLAPGLHQGTFSGRILGTSTRATGSFRC